MLKSFEVTYKTGKRKTETAVRFYENAEAAVVGCNQVLTFEQGCPVVSITETLDPRTIQGVTR